MTPEELMEEGRKLQFRSVRMKQGHVLLAGEVSWLKFLKYSTPRQRKMLEDALWKESEGPGFVGVVCSA